VTKIAVALSLIALASSPTLAQTHRQWETIYRPLPPILSSPSSQFGATGEYNAPVEERGANFKMRKRKKAKRSNRLQHSAHVMSHLRIKAGGLPSARSATRWSR
jgi:hypothetical protein